MVSFPKNETWIGNREVISFQAEVDGKYITCEITREALQDKLDAHEAELMTCFTKNRLRIETTALKLIEKQRYEPDGSVLIRSIDIH